MSKLKWPHRAPGAIPRRKLSLAYTVDIVTPPGKPAADGTYGLPEQAELIALADRLRDSPDEPPIIVYGVSTRKQSRTAAQELVDRLGPPAEYRRITRDEMYEFLGSPHAGLNSQMRRAAEAGTRHFVLVYTDKHIERLLLLGTRPPATERRIVITTRHRNAKLIVSNPRSLAPGPTH